MICGYEYKKCGLDAVNLEEGFNQDTGQEDVEEFGEFEETKKRKITRYYGTNAYKESTRSRFFRELNVLKRHTDYNDIVRRTDNAQKVL